MNNNEERNQSTVDIILIKIFVPALTAGVIGLGALIWNLVANDTTKQFRIATLEEKVAKLETKQESLEDDISSNKSKVKVLENDLAYIKTGIDDIKKDIKELKR